MLFHSIAVEHNVPFCKYWTPPVFVSKTILLCALISDHPTKSTLDPTSLHRAWIFVILSVYKNVIEIHILILTSLVMSQPFSPRICSWQNHFDAWCCLADAPISVYEVAVKQFLPNIYYTFIVSAPPNTAWYTKISISVELLNEWKLHKSVLFTWRQFRRLFLCLLV